MKTVAIVGLASETAHYAKELPLNGEEVWSLNTGAELYPEMRPSRMFDMHPLWLMRSRQYNNGYNEKLDHWGWLKAPHSFPIYTVEDFSPLIPASVEYPVNEVALDVFSGIYRGGDPVAYFACTFNYMLGLAIHEKFERINIYGFEMAQFSEFVYQKAAAEAMMGIAAGRGIEVHLVEKSRLMNSKLYGYEEAQAVTRRRLEQVKKFYEAEHSQAESEFNIATGRFLERQEAGGDTKELAEALQQLNALIYINMGATLALGKIIAELDEDSESDLSLRANLTWMGAK